MTKALYTLFRVYRALNITLLLQETEEPFLFIGLYGYAGHIVACGADCGLEGLFIKLILAYDDSLSL